MNWNDDKAQSEVEWPGEDQLRRDIRHFERQIARLASPASAWERGALKCYQVLAKQRRRVLEAMRSSELSDIQAT